MELKKTVIIVAGGKGLRMGEDLPKQFIPLQGKPILMHTLDAFYRCDQAIDIVLVIPEDHSSYWEMLCRELNFTVPHRLVHGGETRFHSARNGLLSIPVSPQSPNHTDLIAVHDGVRPFVSSTVISTCYELAETYGAAIPVAPMIETVRVLDGAENHSFDRAQLCIVQTPQIFRADILRKAYEQPYESRFTDDASLVDASGHPIHLFEGNPENIKITTQRDLHYAKTLIKICSPIVPSSTCRE